MKKAFTLIELLIVIAIVGILVAISTASYLTALKQSRDTRRKTDLEQIRQALETYRSETGSYPTTVEGMAVLAPSYITTVPTDPQSDLYTYTAPTISTYSLCTTLEVTTASYCVAQP